MTKTNPSASALAAQRLGYGLDPLDQALADLEELLSRDEWQESDSRRAREVLASIRELSGASDEEEPEEIETRPATASEIAGMHMNRGRKAARELREQGIPKLN